MTETRFKVLSQRPTAEYLKKILPAESTEHVDWLHEPQLSLLMNSMNAQTTTHNQTSYLSSLSVLGLLLASVSWWAISGTHVISLSNDVKEKTPGNSELNYQKEASGTVYPVCNYSTKLNESTVSNSNNDRKIFNENSVLNGHNNEDFELQAV